MKKCNWTRARSNEQKEQRIKEIISATERLYRKISYKNITFVDIAKEAGFTRSNLYKYFQSKEEIFLEILISDFRLWKLEVKNAYVSEHLDSIQVFAKKWINVLQNNPRLIELMSILYLHLEKETSFGALLKFKNELNKDYTEIIQILMKSIDGFTSKKVIKFLNLQSALVVGLHQTCNLSENQTKILEKQEFSHYKIDFNEIFSESVIYILNGIINS